MQTKTAPTMTVVSYSLTTNMKNLKQDVGNSAMELTKAVVAANLHPTGPQTWIYTWTDMNPEADFTLKLCLPVATFGESFKSEKYKLEVLTEFKHLSLIHNGAWEKMGESYEKIMSHMKSENMQGGFNCREIYINCDFDTPENNITEIQCELL